MKIALLDSWLQGSAEGSGTAVGLKGLTAALQARGHSVTRWAPSARWPRGLTMRRLLFNLELRRPWPAQTYDLVIGSDFDGVCWSTRRANVPYVVTIKGVLAEESRYEQGFPRVLLQALAHLEARNARGADLVLATSDYCREAIVRNYGLPPERLRVVPEGIDLQRWRCLASRMPQASDGRTILCVARQYPRKHVADLLRALPRVRRTVGGAHAVLIGDGPEHERLRRLAAELELGDAVQFLGALADHDQVAIWYRRADVFCLPSVQEGFGIVFLEAMACGLPVVATQAAAIPEVVPDRQAGLLVPPGDVEALASALTTLLCEPSRREAYGAHAQAVVQRYDWDVVAGQFLAAVEPLTRGSTSRSPD